MNDDNLILIQTVVNLRIEKELSLRSIASKVGISHEQVRNILSAANISTRRIYTPVIYELKPKSNSKGGVKLNEHLRWMNLLSILYGELGKEPPEKPFTIPVEFKKTVAKAFDAKVGNLYHYAASVRQLLKAYYLEGKPVLRSHRTSLYYARRRLLKAIDIVNRNFILDIEGWFNE